MISPHAADHVGADELATLRDWKPRVATVFNLALQHAHEIKQATPNTLLIGRPYVPDEEMEYRILMDPNAAGDFAADMVFRSPGHGAIDFWQGPANEVAHTSPEHLREHNTFALRYMAHLHHAKLKACILNPSVGWPPTFEEDGGASWREVFPALRAALAGGSILGLHAYGKKSLGSLIVDRQYLINRFEIGAWPYFPDDLKALRYAYTEYGTDELNYGGPREGWIGPYGGDAQAFINELQEAIKPTLDKPCLGAAVYTFGAENKAMWGSYDIRGECAKLMARTTWPVAKYTPAAPVVPPPPPKVEGPMIRVLMPSGTVQTMPVEEYLRGVVPSEMPASWMPHALMAQAVAARTYARYNIAHPKHHFQGADVCTEVHCQVYNPAKIAATTDQAIQATADVVLWHDRKPINAVYSARCGGKTASGKERWNVEVAYWQSTWCPCSPNGEARHGHGVGLCQHGAQRLAQQGHDWQTICHHYYQDVGIGKEAEMSVTRLISMLRAEFGDKFRDVRSQMTVSKTQKFNYADSRKMKYIVLHHATGSRDVTAKAISDFHVNTRGWAGIGYHTVGRLGELYLVGDPDTARAHVAGRNHEALGHCITGDYTSRDAAPEDVDVFRRLVKVYDAYYGHKKELAGHSEMLAPGHTTCPGRLWAILKDARMQVTPVPAVPVVPTEPVPDPVAAVHSLGIAEPELAWSEPFWEMYRAEMILDGKNQVHIMEPPDHNVQVTRTDTGDVVSFPLATTKMITLGGPRVITITPGKSTAVSVARTGASLRLWFRPATKVRAA